MALRRAFPLRQRESERIRTPAHSSGAPATGKNETGSMGITTFQPRRARRICAVSYVYYIPILIRKPYDDLTATSNHEGHKGAQRKCASSLFPFVRFGSLGVQPSMTSRQQATTKVTKGHEGHALHYRQTGGITSALRSHQGTPRQCASLFPFVHFGSLVVKPSMTSPQQATTKVTKGHKRNALHVYSPSCASGPSWLLHRNKQPRRSPRDTKDMRFIIGRRAE